MGKKGKGKPKAEDFKEKGNLAYKNGDFERALTLYSKGLEVEPANAILLSNRAAAYIALHKYEDALADGTKATEVDPNYAKGFYRQADALRNIDHFYEAMTIVTSALERLGQNSDLETLRSELEKEIAVELRVPLDHPERIKFQGLIDWLHSGGADFPKLKMRFYSTDYRGVHSTTFIPKGEVFMFIPKSHIITLEMAKSAPVGSKMMAANLNLLSPKHCYLSSFLLQERRKPDSFWKPYLQILPQYFSSFPIFYGEAEKEWLKGSPFLDSITEKVADIEIDYKAICEVAPEFAEYPIEEFSRMRMAVSSRIFGMDIDGIKTDGFVPLADMLNHRRPRQTSWTYDQERGGFTIEALEDINRGEEVLDSYGKKCNYRFLLNYGFINRDNDADECPIKLSLKLDDQHYAAKQNLIGGMEPITVRMMAYFSEKAFEELFGVLRFIEFDDMRNLVKLTQVCTDQETNSFKPQLTPPQSIANELRVLTHLKSLMEERLGQYLTTLEEDIALLDTDLTENQRNIVLIRKGEKVILHWYLKLTEVCIPFLQCADQKEFKNKKRGTVYDEYISSVLTQLFRAENKT